MIYKFVLKEKKKETRKTSTGEYAKKKKTKSMVLYSFFNIILQNF